MTSILPKPSLIVGPAKIPDMISISSKGICGGDDCRCPRLKEVRLWVGKRGAYQIEKRRYALDMKGFGVLGKFLRRAAIGTAF
jgi:hypothetical protein